MKRIWKRISNKKGVLLLEALIGVTILALVITTFATMVSSAGYISLQTYRNRISVQKMYYNLETSRKEALKTGSVYSLQTTNVAKTSKDTTGDVFISLYPTSIEKDGTRFADGGTFGGASVPVFSSATYAGMAMPPLHSGGGLVKPPYPAPLYQDAKFVGDELRTVGNLYKNIPVLVTEA